MTDAMRDAMKGLRAAQADEATRTNSPTQPPQTIDNKEARSDKVPEPKPATKTPSQNPSSGHGGRPPGPIKWEDRTKRHTFHAERTLIAGMTARSQETGESLSRIINRAIAELLEREGTS